MNELNSIVTYTPIVTGVWSVSMALIMNTSNMLSAMIFKVIPFFLGTASLYAGAVLNGWI
jgi:hypothetical protein